MNLKSSTHPLIIAHRGARLKAPENTLAAFDLAKKMGAQGVELDILVSADGHLVVTHNEDLSLLTSHSGKISGHTLKELKQIDFGQGEKIPTLAEVFDLLGRDFWINVEIKGENIFAEGREQKLFRLIQDFKMQENMLVSSFNIFALRRMRQIAPQIKRGYLFYERQDPFSTRAAFDFLFQPYSYHPSRVLADKKLLEKLKKKNKKIWVWTVNEVDEARALVESGVEGLITDDPRKMLEHFKNTGNPIL
ncbi:MAG: hypothetical protein HQM15_01485 [Deltaproteobacteria bacterium]|nr:hypothetical protein [Deltaproteobacteria bacterium]